MSPGAEGDQYLAATSHQTPLKVLLDLKSFSLVSLLAPHLWPSQLQFTTLLSLLIIALGCIVNALAPLTLGALITTFNNPGVAPFPSYGSSSWPYLITYVVLTFLSFGGLPALHYALWIPNMQYSDRTMSMRIFNHILALSLGWHTKHKTNELLYMLHRGTAMNRVGELVYFTVLPAFLNVVVSVVVFIIKFELSLGVVVGAAMAGYIWAGVMLTRYRTRVKRQMDDQDMVIRGIQTDTLLNHETVKYFGGNEHEAQKYAEAIGKYQSSEKDFNFASNFHGLMQTLIITLGFLVGSTIVTSRISTGKSSTSDFIVFVTYYAQLYFPLSQLGSVYRSIDQCLIDDEKLLNFLTEPTEPVDAPDAKELVVENGEVEFVDVTFSYDGTTPALKDVSFKVPRGGRVVVVGESGAGKSTILRLLYRLYQPDEGRILIDGQDIRTVTLSSLRNAIGLLPQDPVLFDASIGYNIAYGHPSMTLPPQSTIIDAAQAAGIHEHIMSFPDGYETKVGECGMRLSGREKRGVSLARTIVKNPKLLLLDEAASALDGVKERAALAQLVDGKSCLSISHRLDTIKATDMVIVLKEGRIVEQGSRKELSALGGLFASMRAADRTDVSEELRTYEAPVVDVPEPENRALGKWIAAPRTVRREDLGLSISPDSGSPVTSLSQSEMSPLAFPTTTTTNVSNPSSVDGMGHLERPHTAGAGVTFDPGAISRAGSPDPGSGSGRRMAQGFQRLARRISVGGNGKGLKSHSHGHHRETSVSSASASGSGGVSTSPPVSTKKPESIEESHHVEKAKEEKRKKRGHLL